MILGSVIVIIWYICVSRIYSQNVSGVQKIFTPLPYIKFILCLLLFYYIESAGNDESYSKDGLMRIYLDTIATTIMSIYKTIMWFIIVMIASVL